MNKTEKKLLQLFDYQKFEKNTKLEQEISDILLEDGVVEISDEALFGVAGGRDRSLQNIKDQKNGEPPEL